MSNVFLEAESFRHLGGWVVDQQSMHIMGSAYVMAHGMGVPVPDATTRITLPTTGRWHAWVRTRDWAAVWGRGSAPGLFRLKLDDTYFANTLGNNGAEWDWQYAGVVETNCPDVKLSLCDLTGFNGRCDAVYLTTEEDDRPENTETFRRRAAGVTVKTCETEYDLVVCGGGIAGVCMALTATREGLHVVLLQDRPVLGGCNSSEIKVGLGGFIRSQPYPNLGNVLEEISPVFGAPGSFAERFYEDDRKLNAFSTVRCWAKGKGDVCLNERVVELEMEDGRLHSVTTKHIRTGEMKRYIGRLFADCTGDATLARLGGAEVMYGREAMEEYGEQLAPEVADRMVMGMTVTWNTELCGQETGFPDVDWGIPFDEEHCYKVFSGDWEWEAGQFRDMADETEYIRDYSLMTIFGNWSYLKNHCPDNGAFRKRRLNWVSPYGGKRESYRVKGDLVLTQKDIEDHVHHEDGTASMTWDIDIHYPDPAHMRLFPEPFRSCAIHRGIGEHYPVPYRCLYSRDIPNLFLGGRVVSTTHVAFSCVRVMRTLGVLGEVVGLAAGICKREGCLPRQVYTEHLDQLKAAMERGVPIKPYHAYEAGEYEHFAFPDCNQYHTHPNKPITLPLDDKEMMWRINHIGARYLTYDRFAGVEEREELTEEEQAITRAFYERIGR